MKTDGYSKSPHHRALIDTVECIGKIAGTPELENRLVLFRNMKNSKKIINTEKETV